MTVNRRSTPRERLRAPLHTRTPKSRAPDRRRPYKQTEPERKTPRRPGEETRPTAPVLRCGFENPNRTSDSRKNMSLHSGMVRVELSRSHAVTGHSYGQLGKCTKTSRSPISTRQPRPTTHQPASTSKPQPGTKWLIHKSNRAHRG